jgi:hypothetical protein
MFVSYVTLPLFVSYVTLPLFMSYVRPPFSVQCWSPMFTVPWYSRYSSSGPSTGTSSQKTTVQEWSSAIHVVVAVSPLLTPVRHTSYSIRVQSSCPTLPFQSSCPMFPPFFNHMFPSNVHGTMIQFQGLQVRVQVAKTASRRRRLSLPCCRSLIALLYARGPDNSRSVNSRYGSPCPSSRSQETTVQEWPSAFHVVGAVSPLFPPVRHTSHSIHSSCPIFDPLFRCLTGLQFTGTVLRLQGLNFRRRTPIASQDYSLLVQS